MSKLDLVHFVPVDESGEELLRPTEDILKEIEETLQEMGVDDYPRPDKPPPHLAEGVADRADDLSDAELAQLHAQYVAYGCFLNGRLSYVSAAASIAEENLSAIKSHLAVKMYAEKIPKVEIPDRIRLNGRFQELSIESLKLECMKKILEAHYATYSKQAQAVSRLITLRTQDIDDQHRDAGIKNRGRRLPLPKPKSFR